MLRNALALVLAIHLLGRFWSVTAVLLITAGAVGVTQLCWHILSALT